jgi:hypothetical protein
MTDEKLSILVGFILIVLGALLLILKLGRKAETIPFGKAARGQMIVLSIALVIGGLILIFKNI